jgi:drug/metabolite transporter (DMT)-like permease
MLKNACDRKFPMSDIAPVSQPIANRRSLFGWLAALATVAIWAIWIVGTRHAVTHDLPPAAVGLLRFAVPALVLAPVVWRIGLFPKGLSPLLGLGLLGSGAPFFLTVAMGMQYAPAAEIAPLLPGTMPLFVAVIGWLAFAERPGRAQLAGYGLIVLGVACIGGRGIFHLESGAWRGHLLLLAGACLWGIYTHAYRRSGLSALQAAALVGFWSMLMLLPFGISPLVSAMVDGRAGAIVLQALLQGLLTGIAGIVLYGLAVDRLGASRAAAVSPLSLVLATLIAIPVLGEIPNEVAVIGIIAAALGVLLASGALNRR